MIGHIQSNFAQAIGEEQSQANNPAASAASPLTPGAALLQSTAGIPGDFLKIRESQVALVPSPHGSPNGSPNGSPRPGGNAAAEMLKQQQQQQAAVLAGGAGIGGGPGFLPPPPGPQSVAPISRPSGAGAVAENIPVPPILQAPGPRGVWSEYLKINPPTILDLGAGDGHRTLLAGAWGECLVWAAVYEHQHPEWRRKNVFKDSGPAGQVIDYLAALGYRDRFEAAAQATEEASHAACEQHQAGPLEFQQIFQQIFQQKNSDHVIAVAAPPAPTLIGLPVVLGAAPAIWEFSTQKTGWTAFDQEA